MTTDIERSNRRQFWTGVLFGVIVPTLGAVAWASDLAGDVRRNETAILAVDQTHRNELGDELRDIKDRLAGVEMLLGDMRTELAATKRELELRRTNGRRRE